MSPSILPNLLFALLLLVSPAMAQKPLVTYKNCTFEKTDWADGDSFLVKPPVGEAISIRLYGADCIEWHVTDATDSRRLRAQRSYFGISRVDPDPNQAAEIAKGFGKEAAAFVETALQKPFTVHTAGADARGDENYTRVYAFIVTADGKDLAQELVKVGLARAFGVTRATYDVPPRSGDEYDAALDDLELQAATNKRGVWAKTNWNQLPEERKIQREEEAKDEIGIDNAKDLKGKKVNPNTASRGELMNLPGVGEATANAIIGKRPYAKAEDLLNVPGIGPKSLEKIKPHLEFGK
jgi:competence ComEA-like helix-hairpin-helix protein